MKKIILILITLAAFSCKKKTTTPTPVVEQPLCKTYAASLVGKYKIEGRTDTIQILFMQTNCPSSSQNIYQIKKLGEAVQYDVIQGYTFDINDYVFYMNEQTSLGNCGAQFDVNSTSNNIIISSKKLNHEQHLIKL